MLFRIMLFMARRWAGLKALLRLGPRTFEEMLARSRHTEVDPRVSQFDFDWRASRFTDFGVRCLKLGDLGGGEIVGNLARRGLKPASLEQHLAYCAKRPRMHGMFSECDRFVSFWTWSVLEDHDTAVSTTDIDTGERLLEAVPRNDTGQLFIDLEDYLLVVPA